MKMVLVLVSRYLPLRVLRPCQYIESEMDLVCDAHSTEK